jgi:hypothetical protein
MNIVKAGSDLSVPIVHRAGVGTLPGSLSDTWQVVKASSGHFPQPFLIRDVKNWDKDNAALPIFPNFYLFFHSMAIQSSFFFILR